MALQETKEARRMRNQHLHDRAVQHALCVQNAISRIPQSEASFDKFFR